MKPSSVIVPVRQSTRGSSSAHRRRIDRHERRHRRQARRPGELRSGQTAAQKSRRSRDEYLHARSHVSGAPREHTSKVAIVTGAGTGIGRAVALGLLDEGYAVVLAGRRAALLEETVADAGSHGDARARRADRRRPIRHRCGRCLPRRATPSDGSTCCSTTPASNTRGVPLEELTVEQWKSVVDVNLTGAFLCTQQAFLLMKDQQPRGGRIINNGSISAHVAPSALRALHRDQARDHRAHEIDRRSTAADTTSRAGRSTSAMPPRT